MSDKVLPMDSLRGFRDVSEAASLPAVSAHASILNDVLSRGDDDAGIEAPPMIGTDERRMQVRAYNFWVQMLGEHSLPSAQELDLHNLGDFGDHAILLDFTRGIENPGVTHLGKAIQEACGLNDKIKRLSEVPGRSLLSRLTDHYLQIIANQAPIGFEAEFQNESGTNIAYRGILLPFSSDGETIDFILGVINWKEVASAILASELEAEVSDALLSPKILKSKPSAPSWADGPDSQALGIFGADGDDGDAASDEIVDDALDDQLAGEGANLADWLAVARESAVQAQDVEARGRGALYRAIGRAYDFALAIEDHQQEYKELLADAGMKHQARAPMTPVIKLVFGSEYDKTRVTEYATVISHAKSHAIGRGDLALYLNGYEGGLKALVKAERAAKRRTIKTQAVVDQSKSLEALRDVHPSGFAELNAGDNEFVLLVARKVSDSQVGVVGALNDHQLLDKVLRKLCQ